MFNRRNVSCVAHCHFCLRPLIFGTWRRARQIGKLRDVRRCASAPKIDCRWMSTTFTFFSRTRFVCARHAQQVYNEINNNTSEPINLARSNQLIYSNRENRPARKTSRREDFEHHQNREISIDKSTSARIQCDRVAQRVRNLPPNEYVR